VRVEALCRLESLSFVHNLYHRCGQAELRAGLGQTDLARASFGRSVTGGAEISAREIIAELNGRRAGPLRLPG